MTESSDKEKETKRAPGWDGLTPDRYRYNTPRNPRPTAPLGKAKSSHSERQRLSHKFILSDLVLNLFILVALAIELECLWAIALSGMKRVLAEIFKNGIAVHPNHFERNSCQRFLVRAGNRNLRIVLGSSAFKLWGTWEIGFVRNPQGRCSSATWSGTETEIYTFCQGIQRSWRRTLEGQTHSLGLS